MLTSFKEWFFLLNFTAMALFFAIQVSKRRSSSEIHARETAGVESQHHISLNSRAADKGKIKTLHEDYNQPKNILDYANVPTEELVSVLKERIAQPYNDTPPPFDQPCVQRPIFNEKGCKADCEKQLSTDPEKRLLEVLSAKELQITTEEANTILEIGRQIPVNDVIYVSAASSNHFLEMQAMFKSMHSVIYPRLNNFSVVLFDLGLSEQERESAKENCRCQVIVFPFELFPPHVKDLHCFAWKPIIVLAVIARANKLVVWQDASIRWNDLFGEFLEGAMNFGHQFVWRWSGRPTVIHTIKETFDYMHIDPCPFWSYPEVAASCHAHRNDPFVVRSVLGPVAKCALEKACICPKESSEIIWCRNASRPVEHRCHRFDQSALTLVLARIYGKDLYKLSVPRQRYTEQRRVVQLMRGDTDHYFEN